MSVYTRTDVVTIKGVQFDVNLWIDESDMTIDVEGEAQCESQYLYYPGSTLVDVSAHAYGLPIGDWLSHYEPIAISAMSEV